MKNVLEFTSRAKARSFAKENGVTAKDNGADAAVRWTVTVEVAEPVALVDAEIAAEVTGYIPRNVASVQAGEQHKIVSRKKNLFAYQVEFNCFVAGDLEFDNMLQVKKHFGETKLDKLSEHGLVGVFSELEGGNAVYAHINNNKWVTAHEGELFKLVENS